MNDVPASDDSARLGELYAACDAGGDDAAVDMLFARIDGLFQASEFGRADELLDLIDLERLTTPVMVALLAITRPTKHRLQRRTQLVARVESKLRATEPRRVERLLKRLR